MKNHLLLPNKCRLIGLVSLPFAITWLIATGMCNAPVFGFLKINSGMNKPNSIFNNSSDFLFSRGFSADLNLTCAIVLTIAALFMLAFAKEKKEDEYVRMM